jgi:hypothetical protein
MRIRMAVGVLLVILAGCGGAKRRSPVPAVRGWHSVCGRFSQDDFKLRSRVWTFGLDPYSPSDTSTVIGRVRADLETLERYLTHAERIGLGRYRIGVDSVERGFDAYQTGDVRGARDNFNDGIADLDASRMTSVCAA